MKQTNLFFGYFVIFLILTIAINAHFVSAENFKAQEIIVNPATSLIDVNTSIIFKYQFTSTSNPTLSVPIRITLGDGSSWTETVSAVNSTLNNTHTFYHVFTSPGTFDINISLDPVDTILEDDESDNNITTTTTITGAIYNVTLSSAALTTPQGTNANGLITASNLGNVNLYSVTLISSDFVSALETIPASSVTLSPSLIGTFFRNTSNNIAITIAVPILTSPGTYTGNITLTYNNGTSNVDVISPMTLIVLPFNGNFKAQEIIVNPATSLIDVNTSIIFKYQFTSTSNPTLSVPIRITLGDGSSWTETVSAVNSTLNNTHTFYHVFTSPGTFDINISLDPVDTILEDDESDNNITTTTTITGAIYNVTLSSAALTTPQGTNANGLITASNLGNVNLYSVTLISSDFVSALETIPASSVTLSPSLIGTFFRNTSNNIAITIAVPILTSPGTYTGNITLTYNNGTSNVDVISPMTLTVGDTTEPPTGGGGGGGGGYFICVPIWECSDWSSCNDGTQTRICADTRCNITYSTYTAHLKPNLTRLCDSTTELNETSGDELNQENEETAEESDSANSDVGDENKLTGLVAIIGIVKSGWFIASAVIILVLALAFFGYKWLNKPSPSGKGKKKKTKK